MCEFVSRNVALAIFSLCLQIKFRHRSFIMTVLETFDKGLK
jgi:hypothetical protein